jgi:hypothetical protein
MCICCAVVQDLGPDWVVLSEIPHSHDVQATERQQVAFITRAMFLCNMTARDVNILWTSKDTDA